MNCPKCGSENSDSSKFCKQCGAKLQSNSIVSHSTGIDDKNKKIIIALIAIIAILAVGIILYAGGVFGSNVPIETHEFDGFKMDVPVGSDFKLSDSYTTNPKNIFVGYLNKGDYSMDAFGFQVGTNVSEKIVKSFADFIEEDGDLKIYKNESDDGQVFYEVFKKGDEANIIIYGDDLDLIKKMGKSFKDKDFKKLASKAESKKPVSSQSTSTTPSSISILGGSFSTGSGEADKTYARIDVGANHAGENVIVQIWYSRDGNTLNNGNMVPATVHSDGYLEISSADAYKYYPDYATINIYDSNSHLLTSQSVSLSPESGTQYF